MKQKIGINIKNTTQEITGRLAALANTHGWTAALSQLLGHPNTKFTPKATRIPTRAGSFGMLSLWAHTGTYDILNYRSDNFEPYTTELWLKSIHPKATVLDLGAQFGYFALLAAHQVGPQGKIYAFEPETDNFSLLKRNIADHKFEEVIQPIPYAVGETNAEKELVIYHGSDSHGFYPHPHVSVRNKTNVQCIAIDDFLKGKEVQVIKMDIEGHEPWALKGMQQTITRQKNLILFAELCPTILRRAGIEPTDYLKQLKDLGFKIELIDETARCLRPLELNPPEYDRPTWHANLYCTKQI